MDENVRSNSPDMAGGKRIGSRLGNPTLQGRSIPDGNFAIQPSQIKISFPTNDLPGWPIKSSNFIVVQTNPISLFLLKLIFHNHSIYVPL
jgi:hypothetical protein